MPGSTSVNPGPQAKILSDKIATTLLQSNTYAILDFPNYPNVGDSAIFLGQLALLRNLTKAEPASISTFRTFHGDPGFGTEKGTVFIQGGGNLGSLWPDHQIFRERVLQTLQDTKIVQLPQSIHFETEDGTDQFARAIDGHSDFTLLLRDQPSMDLAQAKFNCDCHLCPDGAMALSKLVRLVDPMHSVLCMIRDDKESSMGHSFEQFGPVEDWTLDDPRMKPVPSKLIEKAARAAMFDQMPWKGKLASIYETWAQARLDRGIRQLSRAECTVTDRLHVHILCELLRIPHVVMDNSYGKIGRYMDAWGSGEMGVLVSGPDQVAEALAQLRYGKIAL